MHPFQANAKTITCRNHPQPGVDPHPWAPSTWSGLSHTVSQSDRMKTSLMLLHVFNSYVKFKQMIVNDGFTETTDV